MWEKREKGREEERRERMRYVEEENVGGRGM